jgi:polyisoprenoid-binding protein YceI
MTPTILPEVTILRTATQRNLLRCSGGILSLTLALVSPYPLHGEHQAIDVDRSKLSIQVFKSGLFSAFAHNHEIEAPIAEGSVDMSVSTVTLRIDARRLRVADPDTSADTRAEIQKTMEGPMVLDVEHFPEIAFESTGVQALGEDRWRIGGDLALHGKTTPVIVDVGLRDGHYRGSATIKQKDFGIRPVSIAGGSVKVKDEVRIEFDIALTR